jgi:Pyruvate phosphate dikinase, AMP/ATP-binding domain
MSRGGQGPGSRNSKFYGWFGQALTAKRIIVPGRYGAYMYTYSNVIVQEDARELRHGSLESGSPARRAVQLRTYPRVESYQVLENVELDLLNHVVKIALWQTANLAHKIEQATSLRLTFQPSTAHLNVMTPRISFMDRLSIPSSSCSNGLLARVKSGGGDRLPSKLRSSVISSGKGASSRAFYDLDLEDFDSSLGCPLKNYENATLALVGGKALQCWRLTKHGFPVPTAFIIPTYVYSLHVEEAGVAGLIQEVFKSELMNKSCRPANEAKLESIREAIMTTPLQKEVVENLGTFLDAMKDGTRVAVRSSGSAEDLASQSFAGQYDTFLYKQTIEEVEESVKACWAR